MVNNSSRGRTLLLYSIKDMSAQLYYCCALAVCACCPVIKLFSVCKDVLEIL
jgi:hypothetical protein